MGSTVFLLSFFFLWSHIHGTSGDDFSFPGETKKEVNALEDLEEKEGGCTLKEEDREKMLVEKKNEVFQLQGKKDGDCVVQ